MPITLSFITKTLELLSKNVREKHNEVLMLWGRSCLTSLAAFSSPPVRFHHWRLIYYSIVYQTSMVSTHRFQIRPDKPVWWRHYDVKNEDMPFLSPFTLWFWKLEYYGLITHVVSWCPTLRWTSSPPAGRNYGRGQKSNFLPPFPSTNIFDQLFLTTPPLLWPSPPLLTWQL